MVVYGFNGIVQNKILDLGFNLMFLFASLEEALIRKYITVGD